MVFSLTRIFSYIAYTGKFRSEKNSYFGILCSVSLSYLLEYLLTFMNIFYFFIASKELKCQTRGRIIEIWINRTIGNYFQFVCLVTYNLFIVFNCMEALLYKPYVRHVLLFLLLFVIARIVTKTIIRVAGIVTYNTDDGFKL